MRERGRERERESDGTVELKSSCCGEVIIVSARLSR